MEQLQLFRKECQVLITKYPNLKPQITENYLMARDEIQGGESPSNEISLARSEITQLIKENTWHFTHLW